jgi:hypothetical protein
MAGWRNVANQVRGENRRKTREEKFVQLSNSQPNVEVLPDVGNVIQEEKLSEYRMNTALNALWGSSQSRWTKGFCS